MPGVSVAWMKRLEDFMSDGKWHTIREVAIKFNISENSASANIRKLRNSKYGSHLVEAKPDIIDNKQLWFYRLIPTAIRS